jgi:proteasome accessory factor B
VPVPPTKLQRWLDLIAFLVGRRFPVSVEEIMDAVPSYAGARAEGSIKAHDKARRMFERDKAELREAGIPIETVTYTMDYGTEVAEGYRLARRDFFLPYLRVLNGKKAGGVAASTGAPARATPDFEVHEDELRTVLAGLEHVRDIPASPLAAAAASAYRKLTFDLPVSFPSRPRTVYLDPPGAPDSRETLETLSAAIRSRKAVRIEYHGIRRRERTERSVRPYALLFRGSRWYLIGHDELRNDIRVFRVSRMRDVAVNPKHPRTPDYDIPDDFDVSEFATREAWQLGRRDEPPIKARVQFRFPRSLWAERNGHGTLVEQRPDGSSIREFELIETAPFLAWLLPQGPDATLELPAELRAELHALAARVAVLHAPVPT